MGENDIGGEPDAGGTEHDALMKVSFSEHGPKLSNDELRPSNGIASDSTNEVVESVDRSLLHPHDRRLAGLPISGFDIEQLGEE